MTSSPTCGGRGIPDSLDLLESVDPDLWQACGGDPGKMLGEVSGARLSVLARDRRFLRRLDDVHEDLTDYLTRPRWYQQQQAAGLALPRASGTSRPSSGSPRCCRSIPVVWASWPAIT